MLLTPCVELWKTPGHTMQDASAIVYNVTDYGTVAVVGKGLPTCVKLVKSNNWMVRSYQ